MAVDVEIKLYVKDVNIDECNVSFLGDVIGSYNVDTDTVKISLSKLWKKNENVEKFVNGFASDMSHEFIHRAVREEMDDSKLGLGAMYLTSQEWVTKKLNGEKMDELCLMPNIYQDMRNIYLSGLINKDIDTTWKRWRVVRNIYIITMGAWIIYFILITVRMLVN